MLIGCTLTKNRPSVEWNYSSEPKEYHSLVLRQVNVGVGLSRARILSMTFICPLSENSYDNRDIHLSLSLQNFLAPRILWVFRRCT